MPICSAKSTLREVGADRETMKGNCSLAPFIAISKKDARWTREFYRQEVLFLINTSQRSYVVTANILAVALFLIVLFLPRPVNYSFSFSETMMRKESMITLREY